MINETHNLILTEYRGRNDPPTADYANFTSLFDLNADPYQLTNLMATNNVERGAGAEGEAAQGEGAKGEGVEGVEADLARHHDFDPELELDLDLDLDLGFDVGALRTQMYVLANCTGDDCFALGE